MAYKRKFKPTCEGSDDDGVPCPYDAVWNVYFQSGRWIGKYCGRCAARTIKWAKLQETPEAIRAKEDREREERIRRRLEYEARGGFTATDYAANSQS